MMSGLSVILLSSLVTCQFGNVLIDNLRRNCEEIVMLFRLGIWGKACDHMPYMFVFTSPIRYGSLCECL